MSHWAAGLRLYQGGRSTSQLGVAAAGSRRPSDGRSQSASVVFPCGLARLLLNSDEVGWLTGTKVLEAKIAVNDSEAPLPPKCESPARFGRAANYLPRRIEK